MLNHSIVISGFNRLLTSQFSTNLLLYHQIDTFSFLENLSLIFFYRESLRVSHLHPRLTLLIALTSVTKCQKKKRIQSQSEGVLFQCPQTGLSLTQRRSHFGFCSDVTLEFHVLYSNLWS